MRTAAAPELKCQAVLSGRLQQDVAVMQVPVLKLQLLLSHSQVDCHLQNVL